MKKSLRMEWEGEKTPWNTRVTNWCTMSYEYWNMCRMVIFDAPSHLYRGDHFWKRHWLKMFSIGGCGFWAASSIHCCTSAIKKENTIEAEGRHCWVNETHFLHELSFFEGEQRQITWFCGLHASYDKIVQCVLIDWWIHCIHSFALQEREANITKQDEGANDHLMPRSNWIQYLPVYSM